MGFDLMEWCDKNQNICIFLLALVVLQCTGYLTKILNMFGLEGFEVGDLTTNSVGATLVMVLDLLHASEQQVQPSKLLLVWTYIRVASQQLKPEDLPTDEVKQF